MAKKRKAVNQAPEEEPQDSPPSPPPAKFDDELQQEALPSSDQTNSDSDSESDSGSEVEDSPLPSSPSEDIVNVDVEFFDPKPDDYHGVKALLQTFLDDTTWDINAFVELFLAQTTVGTVIKTAEDESPIGIITAFNLARYHDCDCMKEVGQYLQRKSKGKPEAKQFERYWTKKAEDVGLLISERVLNLPTEVVPPLFKGLFEEISWATEDEPTKELQNSFKFKNYLFLTKVFEEPENSSAPNIQRPEGNCEHSDNLIFVKPEDEILLKLSSWSFTFPSTSEASAVRETKDMKQLRLVMGIDANQIPAFLAQLKDFEQ